MVAPEYDQRERALKQKVYGPCREALAEKSDALDAFEEAIRVDPKISAKRRAAQLRPELP